MQCPTGSEEDAMMVGRTMTPHTQEHMRIASAHLAAEMVVDSQAVAPREAKEYHVVESPMTGEAIGNLKPRLKNRLWRGAAKLVSANPGTRQATATSYLLVVTQITVFVSQNPVSYSIFTLAATISTVSVSFSSSEMAQLTALEASMSAAVPTMASEISLVSATITSLTGEVLTDADIDNLDVCESDAECSGDVDDATTVEPTTLEPTTLEPTTTSQPSTTPQPTTTASETAELGVEGDGGDGYGDGEEPVLITEGEGEEPVLITGFGDGEEPILITGFGHGEEPILIGFGEQPVLITGFGYGGHGSEFGYGGYGLGSTGATAFV